MKNLQYAIQVGLKAKMNDLSTHITLCNINLEPEPCVEMCVLNCNVTNVVVRWWWNQKDFFTSMKISWR